MRKLLENGEVVVVLIEISQPLNQPAAIIVKRVFISHEYFCWGVFGQNDIRGIYRTDKRIEL